MIFQKFTAARDEVKNKQLLINKKKGGNNQVCLKLKASKKLAK